MSFGSRLKFLRDRQRVSQHELADVLGVKEATIGNYESGTSSPKMETMIKIFKYFNVTPNYMFQDEMNILESRPLDPKEKILVEKYSFLDYYGKRVVESNIDVQYQRCKTFSEKKY